MPFSKEGGYLPGFDEAVAAYSALKQKSKNGAVSLALPTLN